MENGESTMEDQVYNEAYDMVTKLLKEAHEFLEAKYGADSSEFEDAYVAVCDAAADFTL
jgi:hypothetical protein